MSASYPQWLEAAMLLCFAVSWPIAIVKMLRTRRAEGKSLGFVLLVFAGYLFGIAAKVSDAELRHAAWPAITWLYALNCVTVAIDAALLLYLTAHPRSTGKAWPWHGRLMQGVTTPR